jgi:cobaltochelatase CobT
VRKRSTASVIATLRAIAGDLEIEVGFSKDRLALSGNRARLPEVPK